MSHVSHAVLRYGDSCPQEEFEIPRDRMSLARTVHGRIRSLPELERAESVSWGALRNRSRTSAQSRAVEIIIRCHFERSLRRYLSQRGNTWMAHPTWQAYASAYSNYRLSRRCPDGWTTFGERRNRQPLPGLSEDNPYWERP